MDISKLQSGLGLGVAAQRINLNTLVQEIIQETKVAYPAVKIDFETAFDGNMDADPDRLSQVLTNLLGNAIAHGERDTPVTVFSGKTAAAAYFTVSNRAEVLDAHLLANIFSPYRSGESTSPRNRQGLGLGLHIANEIVKSHRGMIDVAQHEGTISFTVSIPAVGDALV